MMIRLGIIILCVSGCLASHSARSLGLLPEPEPRTLRNQVPFNPIYIPVAETPVSQSIEPVINLHRTRRHGLHNVPPFPNGPNVPFPGGHPITHHLAGRTQAAGAPVLNFNDFISLIRHGTVSHGGPGPYSTGQDFTYVNLGSLIPNAPEVAIPSKSLPQFLQGNSGVSVSHQNTHVYRGLQGIGAAQIPSLSQGLSLGGPLSSALSNINRIPGVPLHPIAALHRVNALTRGGLHRSFVPQHPAATLGNTFGMPQTFNSFPSPISPISINQVGAGHRRLHIANTIQQPLSGISPLSRSINSASLLSNAAAAIPRVPFHPASVLNAAVPIGPHTPLSAFNRRQQFNNRGIQSTSSTSFVHEQRRFSQIPRIDSRSNPVPPRTFFGPDFQQRQTFSRARGSQFRNNFSNSAKRPNRLEDFVRRSSFENQPENFFDTRGSPLNRNGFSGPTFRHFSSRFDQPWRTNRFDGRNNEPFNNRPRFFSNIGPSSFGSPSNIDERIPQNFPRDNFASPRDFDSDFSRPFDSGVFSPVSRNIDPFIPDRFSRSGPDNDFPRPIGIASPSNGARFDPMNSIGSPFSRRSSFGSPSFNNRPDRFFDDERSRFGPDRLLPPRAFSSPNSIPRGFFPSSVGDDRGFQTPASFSSRRTFPRPIGISVPNQRRDDFPNTDTFGRGGPFEFNDVGGSGFDGFQDFGLGPDPRFSSPRDFGFGPDPRSSSPRDFGFGPDPRFSSPRDFGFGPDPRFSSPRDFEFGPDPRFSSPRDFGFGPDSRFLSPRDFGFGPDSRFSSPRDLSTPPFVPTSVLQPQFMDEPRFQTPIGRSSGLNNDFPRPIGIASPSNGARFDPMNSIGSPFNRGAFLNDLDNDFPRPIGIPVPPNQAIDQPIDRFGDFGMRPGNRFGSGPFRRFGPENGPNSRFNDPLDDRLGFNDFSDRNIDRFDPRDSAFNSDGRFDVRGPFDNDGDARSFTPFFQPSFPPLVRSGSGSRFSISPVSREMTRFLQRSPRRSQGSFLISFLVNIDDVSGASDDFGFDVNPDMPRGFQNRFISRNPWSPFGGNGPVRQSINPLRRDIFGNGPRNDINNFDDSFQSNPSRGFSGRNERIRDFIERPWLPGSRTSRTSFPPPFAPSPVGRSFPPVEPVEISFGRRGNIVSRSPFTRRTAPSPSARVVPPVSDISRSPSFSQFGPATDSGVPDFSSRFRSIAPPLRQTFQSPRPFGLAIPDPEGPRNRPFLTAAIQGQFDDPTSSIDINGAFNRRIPGFTSEPVVSSSQGGFNFNRPDIGRSQIPLSGSMSNSQHLLNMGNSIVNSQTPLINPASAGNVGIPEPFISPVNTAQGGSLSSLFNLKHHSNVLRNTGGLLGTVQGQGNSGLTNVFQNRLHVSQTVNSSGPSANNLGQLHVYKKALKTFG